MSQKDNPGHVTLPKNLHWIPIAYKINLIKIKLNFQIVQKIGSSETC